jgi:putative flippase GtrA
MKRKNYSKGQPELTRFVRYMVSGGAWFWSGYILFAVCYSGLKIGVIPSKILAYVFGLTVNFLLERYWVFRGRKNVLQLNTSTLRYLGLSTLNLGIDTLIVWSLSRAGVSPYIGQFISAAFFTGWNYIWYEVWVFTKGAPGPKRAAAPSLHRSRHVRVRNA